MAESFTQVIEVALRSVTDPSLRALLEDLRDLGTQGELTDDQLSGVTSAVEELNQQAAAANGLQASISALEEYRAEQERIAQAVDKSALRIKLAAEQEAAAAQALEESKAALAALRAERDRYNASEEKTTEGTRQFAASLKEAQAAQKAAQAEYSAAAGTLRQATTEYDRAVTAQDKLNAGIGKSEDAIKAAGLSVNDLGQAQAELQKRLQLTSTSTEQLAANLREQVAVNQQAAASARANAAAQQALADANATLGRRGFGEVRAEIEKVRQAYDTLRRSGQLSVQELAQAQSRAIERTRELRAEYGSLGNSLRQVQGSLIAAGASLFTATRLLSDAARTSSEFGTAIAEVSTLLDDTSGIAALEESVKSLAREFGGPAAVQARALYQIISAGATNSADANRILAQSNRLAIAGVSDLKTAADGITSVLNAYGKSAQDAESVSDSLFAAVRAGKTTVDELAGSIGQVAPIAATAGVEFDELAATIATLTQGGVATTQAVTQIRAVLAGVVKPTKDAQKAAEELGIQFNLAALRSQGLAGFLQNISERAGDNEEALSRLFGSVEGLQAVFSLVGQQAGNFERNLASVAGAAGATQAAFEKIDDTPAQRLARFSASVDQLKISFGDAVSALSPVLDGLSSLLNTFNELPASVRTGTAGLVALSAVVAPLAIAIVQSRAALVLLLGSLRAIGPAAAGAGAGVGVFTTAATGATAATGRLTASLGGLSRAFAVLGAAAVGFEIGTALNEPLTRYRLSVDEAAQSTIRFAVDVDAIGQAGAEAAAKFSNFGGVAVKTASEVRLLGEEQREAYRVSLEGLNAFLRGRAEELIAQQRSTQLTAEQRAELDGLFQKLDQVRVGFTNLDSAALGAAESISSIGEFASNFGGASKLADELGAAAEDGERLAKALSGAFDGIDFDQSAGRLGEIALGIDVAASSSEKAAVAIREGLAKQLQQLSGEDLLRFQQGAQFAFDAVGGSAGAASQILDLTLAESYRRLGVNVEAAGIKITEQGRQIIASFRAIATSGNASAQAIGAAFTAALNKAQTTGEVQALEEALRSAFAAGKISAQQLGAAISAAAARTNEISKGAQEASGALDGVGEAGRRMARDLIASLQATRAGLETEAGNLALAIQKGLAAGEPVAALQEQLAGLQGEIAATSGRIAGLQQGLGEVGDAGEDGGKRAANGINSLTPVLKDAALQAKEAAAAVDDIGQQGQSAGEKVKLGVSNALLGLIQVTKDARDSVAEYGEEAVAQFDRLRGELGLVDTTGRSTANVMQLIADRAGFAAKNAEELALQIGNTEERVKRTREEMARLADETRQASSELSDLNRQLQDEADRRAGDEEAIRRREYEEQLRRIAELEAKGGASAAVQAAQARALARKNFEADLAEIRAKEREQIDSNRRVDEDTRRRRGGGGSAGAGLAPTTAPTGPAAGGFAPTINITGSTDPEETARLVARELERLQRRGFNPRNGR